MNWVLKHLLNFLVQLFKTVCGLEEILSSQAWNYVLRIVLLSHTLHPPLLHF